MRSSLMLLLLAGAATPAAAAQDSQASDEPRVERTERSERPRAQRPARPERPVAISNERSLAPAEAAVEHASPAPSGRRSSANRGQQESGDMQGSPAPRAREAGDSVRDWRMRDRQRADSPSAIEERNRRRGDTQSNEGEGLVEQARPLPRVLDRERPRARPEGGFADSNEIDRRPGRVVSPTPRPGTEPPPPPTATAAVAQPTRHWSTQWRSDRRYNWYHYRHRNPARFRIGFYFDPFGWNYHRFGIGWRLWPSYYSSRYWLHDPWHWRLPPAYGPYRWVRYWDDAVLVNIYTGQVVDVIYNFFW